MPLPETIDINGKTYDVSLVEVEPGPDGENRDFILLLSDGEEHKLSPNTTAEELAQYADAADRSHEL